jgi:hypothetical protein
MMFTSLLTVLLGVMQVIGADSFLVAPAISRSYRLEMIPEMIIEPGLLMDGAIALVSAAAGAASQFPRIQELERELGIARSALTEVRGPRYYTVIGFLSAVLSADHPISLQISRN